MPSQVVIVGAGISGLATAFNLQERLPDADITVLEANTRPGGAVWTERKDGFQVELGPNGFLDTRGSTIDLCRRLGIAGDLIPAAPAAAKRYLYLEKQMFPLPRGTWGLLRSPLLPWSAKWRVLTERWRRAAPAAGDESVYDFAARRTSPEVAETFADAFTTGIFAGDPRLLSVAAAFPRLADAERKFGSVAKGLAALARARRAEAAERGDAAPKRGGTLYSFKPGLRLLIEILVMRLKKPPLFGVPARTITVQTGAGPRPRWTVHGEGKERWTADVVILTCPAPRQAGLVADVDNDLADAIHQIPYAPVVVVALGFGRHELPGGEPDGFGFIAPQRTRRDVLGVQFCSSIFPERAPERRVLFRALCGGWHRRDVLLWEDDRLSLAVRTELKRALGLRHPPVFQHITRWDPAIPQYTLGHADRVAQIETLAARHPGLVLSGNAYYGVALNDCTEHARVVADRVGAYLGQPAPV
jgi:oxygen-dependent protoporphyrinogen oxidase